MYLEKYNLTDRVAVVTGGGKNIGLACVQALAEAGAHVIIAEIDPSIAESGKQTMHQAGYEVEVMQLDVTDSYAATATADAVVEKHGKVDILVCNAGIALNTPAEEVSDEEWHKVIDINLNGVFWCCRAFGKHMKNAGNGAIVNLGSMSGIISNKPQPQSHYNASKAAVHMLTRHLAKTLARKKITVNAVAPGPFQSQMMAATLDAFGEAIAKSNPLGRIGEPNDMAGVTIYLASRASAYVTGVLIPVDGGISGLT